MEKSNEGENPELLIRVNRRLDVSKVFFGWVTAIYFMSSLFAIGGLWSEIFVPVARAMIGILLFACGALMYSLYCYWGMVQGGVWYRVRFGVLLGLLVILGGALIRNFGIF